MKYHLLYNPASDNGRGREEAENASESGEDCGSGKP